MGAWGHQPFDNDEACDWRDGKVKLLRTELFHTDRPSACLAIMEAIRLLEGRWHWQEDVDRARAHLTTVFTDEWIAGWKEPDGIMATIKQVMGYLDECEAVSKASATEPPPSAGNWDTIG